MAADRSLSKNSYNSKIGQHIVEGLITCSFQDTQIIKSWAEDLPHLPLNDSPVPEGPLLRPAQSPHPQGQSFWTQEFVLLFLQSLSARCLGSEFGTTNVFKPTQPTQGWKIQVHTLV